MAKTLVPLPVVTSFIKIVLKPGKKRVFVSNLFNNQPAHYVTLFQCRFQTARLLTVILFHLASHTNTYHCRLLMDGRPLHSTSQFRLKMDSQDCFQCKYQFHFIMTGLIGIFFRDMANFNKLNQMNGGHNHHRNQDQHLKNRPDQDQRGNREKHSNGDKQKSVLPQLGMQINQTEFVALY